MHWLTLGGAELSLVSLLRHMDRTQFQTDFLVYSEVKGDYDDEVRSLGAQVFSCPRPTRPLAHFLRFRSVVAGQKPYDIVHSHVTYSGLVLRLARVLGVPGRVAHSRGSQNCMFGQADRLTKNIVLLTNRWLQSDASAGLAVSDIAGEAMFGTRWREDPRWSIFRSGRDFQVFHRPVDSSAVRQELGVPRDAFVIGHVGRMEKRKNHEFLLDLFKFIASRDSSSRLLFVGDGPERQSIQAKVSALQLEDRVILAGSREDVTPLLLGAIDVFVFPSTSEGLPMAVVEAQAAGLPCLVSDTITPDCAVVPGLVKQMPLSAGPQSWADAVVALKSQRRPEQSTCLSTVEQSDFNVFRGVEKLSQLYADLAAKRSSP